MDDMDRRVAAYLLDAKLRHVADAETRNLRQVLLSFLDVLDSLDRLLALASVALERDVSWIDHIQAVREQLLGAFAVAGITFIDCVGRPFDPSRHEAVEMIVRNDLDDYSVVEELARGCEWRDEVLRFARVVVARRPD